MKIIQLTAENVKRLVAVEIRPDGNLVQITGKNGQGKTSVLDSIWWALTGARNIQSAPIRKGASQAKIRLDLGEIVVTRTFKREKEGDDFTTKLEVVGAVKGSPQDMLNSLLDSLAFDPLKFARMDPKEQFAAIRKYVPDVDFDKLAAANSIDFSTRAEKNKRAKEERILSDQIIVDAKAPAERIDETALVTALAEAGKHNSEIALRKEKRVQTERDATAAANRAAHTRQQAEEMIQNAEAMEREAAELREKLAQAPPLPEPVSVEELQAKITQARTLNEQVAKREKKAAHAKTAAAFEAESKALTERMAQRDAEKLAAIEKAKLPVESLTFGDGIVLLNGVPFDQGSDAEQLRASCALAMAGNPTLRVLRVRDGSLLDEDALALLAKMAEERDYQVWIERVGSGNIGFVLEDGQLKERQAAAEVEESAVKE